jgi:hypothetical protein
MQIDVISSLETVDPAAWNALVADCGGNVFLSHEYLRALHETECATARTGWQPSYLIARDGSELAAALPLYLKTHSYGEYVFDWAWADAYKRAGQPYYPKLVSAIPFTPCAGPRLLARSVTARDTLQQSAIEYAQRLGVSSLHLLFTTELEAEAWQAAGFMVRHGVQFHWRNDDYPDFDAMLTAMSHDKRKRIKQDRRYVREAGLMWRVAVGRAIDRTDLQFFFRCYESTYAAHYSTPYLCLEFFERLIRDCGDAVVLFVGERSGERLCTSLCVRSNDTFYGRYWGTVEALKSLHFEACYYQPLEWCIANRIKNFEGGAQGAHKLARGLLPRTTYSAHWIADRRFADAIEHYLHREKIGMMHTIEELNESTPFRRSEAAPQMEHTLGTL